MIPVMQGKQRGSVADGSATLLIIIEQGDERKNSYKKI